MRVIRSNRRTTGRPRSNRSTCPPPDLVLTDWNMPGLDGIDLLRAVRARGKDIPFVFITSEATDEMHSLAYREGAAAVITKPFTAETFEAELGGDYSSKLTQKALLHK